MTEGEYRVALPDGRMQVKNNNYVLFKYLNYYSVLTFAFNSLQMHCLLVARNPVFPFLSWQPCLSLSFGSWQPCFFFF